MEPPCPVPPARMALVPYHYNKWYYHTLARMEIETELQRLKEDLKLVHIRGILNYGLKRKSICSREKITFKDSFSHAWTPDTGLNLDLQLMNKRAHLMSLEEAYSWINDYFYSIIGTFLEDATTAEQRDTITAYTIPVVQGLMTLVSPEELRNMSAAEKKVCEDYLNLRFSCGVYDQLLGAANSGYSQEIGVFTRKHPWLDLRADASVIHLCYTLRQKVDNLPESQATLAIQSWRQLCEALRLISFRDEQKRRYKEKNQALKQIRASGTGQRSLWSTNATKRPTNQTKNDTKQHPTPPGQSRTYTSWASHEPSTTIHNGLQPPNHHRQNIIMRASYPNLSQSFAARASLPPTQTGYNIIHRYRQLPSPHLGQSLRFALRRAFKL
ncbi:MAG: hypothetical protein Q9225_005486 [Loekoesia sp. 1 TL-2023]